MYRMRNIRMYVYCLYCIYRTRVPLLVCPSCVSYVLRLLSEKLFFFCFGRCSNVRANRKVFGIGFDPPPPPPPRPPPHFSFL